MGPCLDNNECLTDSIQATLIGDEVSQTIDQLWNIAQAKKNLKNFWIYLINFFTLCLLPVLKDVKKKRTQ